MEEKIDLHIHTNKSDGKFSAQEIVSMAKEKNLKSIAITDHDSARGIRDLQAIPAGKLFVVPGIEITSKVTNFNELHILGLGINPNSPGIIQLENRVRSIQLLRANIFNNILYDNGLSSLVPSVNSLINNNQGLQNLNFFQILAQNNIPTMQMLEIKEKYTNAIKFIESIDTDSGETLSIIHEAGGFALFAHPYANKHTDNDVYDIISQLMKNNLDGIEVYHKANNAERQILLSTFCNVNNLLISGDSDFHANAIPPHQTRELDACYRINPINAPISPELTEHENGFYI